MDTETITNFTMESTVKPESTMDQPLNLVSAEVKDIIVLVFQVILSNLIALCGLFTNPIVMIVFYKQGILSESSTVGLFALAFCDFCVQITHIILNICDGLLIGEGHEIFGPFYVAPWTVIHLAFRPKIVLGHIQCWLTAYLSFERCFSVLFPFKVKQIFSPRRSLIAVCCIFGGSLVTFSPLLTHSKAQKMVYNNRTFIGISSTNLISDELRQIAILLNPIILRNVGIAIVLISNLLILFKIKASKAWRKSLTNSSSKNDTAKNDQEKKSSKTAFQRDTKLIKMISMISFIFLICTTPDMLSVIFTQTEFAVFGDNGWVAFYAIVFFFESINSSVNILVYYFMSSKFNKQFKILFGIDNKN